MKYPRIVGQVALGSVLATCIAVAPQSPDVAHGAETKFLPTILSFILLDGKPDNNPPPPPPPPPPGTGHDSITSWNGTATCLQCHLQEAEEVFGSVHYQWLGETPYMNNGPETQGKLDVGVNSYCINITGNWNGCGACHVGLGDRPETTQTYAQLENIDCMICHQQEYKRKKVDGKFIPDTDNMSITIVEAAQTVHKPTRATCTQCHAKGGGGDNLKRGDMAIAHASTADRNFDVHMATSGGDLSCQDCHSTSNHRIAGKGSDLRPTDLDVQMSCTDCHETKGEVNGHDNKDIGNHVARVACQTCHIATYARNAADTAASEMTEIHRDWRLPHVTASGPIHPTSTMAGDLVPKYSWWNGTSTSYLLFDTVTIDPITSHIPTSRPSGAVDDANAKLYPFKYKTASQPLATATQDLIALDTSVYFTTGDEVAATEAGLVNMDYSALASYEWVTTDTYQLITHEVSPSSAALSCSACHGSTQRMDLQSDLGYNLKGPESTVCRQCHGSEDNKGFTKVHEKHVEDKNYDCSWCHSFTRPERNLR